jgi:hypothetical protein
MPMSPVIDNTTHTLPTPQLPMVEGMNGLENLPFPEAGLDVD